ncbi:hypothetical protein GCM10018963_54130 [Saccharothrix longispora]
MFRTVVSLVITEMVVIDGNTLGGTQRTACTSGGLWAVWSAPQADVMTLRVHVVHPEVDGVPGGPTSTAAPRMPLQWIVKMSIISAVAGRVQSR